MLDTPLFYRLYFRTTLLHAVSQAWSHSGIAQLQVWVWWICEMTQTHRYWLCFMHLRLWCLTPVKASICSKVWASTCGLSLRSEEAKETRLELRDSQVSIHTWCVKADFNYSMKGEEKTWRLHMTLFHKIRRLWTILISNYNYSLDKYLNIKHVLFFSKNTHNYKEETVSFELAPS